VRHQSNWFRDDDARIHWLEAAGQPFTAALAMVREYLEGLE
jgi:hypothetical protein